MGYNLIHTNAHYLEVSNTRLRRYILTIIIVGSIVGFLLVAGAIFLSLQSSFCGEKDTSFHAEKMLPLENITTAS